MDKIGDTIMVLYKQYYQEELIGICHEKLPFDQLINKSILITGATGMIGSYLLDTFMKLNEIYGLKMEITGACRNKEKVKERVAFYKGRSDIQFLFGDITERIDENKSWDYVIHCAGNNQPWLFGTEPVNTIKTAFIGTLNLLEKCKKRFVFLSSGEVYGSQRCSIEDGFSETDAGTVQTMESRSCYPEGKRAAETLCAAYCQQFRSYTYISDAAIGILYILLKGKAGEAYNVANPNCRVTIREFADQLAAAAGVKVEFASGIEAEKQGYSTMQKEILNVEKLYGLGFQAKVSLKDGMEKVMEIMTEKGC